MGGVKMHHCHILVLALSTFYFSKETPGQINFTKYHYEGLNKLTPHTNASSLLNEGSHFDKDYDTYGYYQLSPIPSFIKYHLHEDVTDVILLETKEVADHKENKKKFLFEDDHHPWDDDHLPAPIELNIEIPEDGITPDDYFVQYLSLLFEKKLNITRIYVDPMSDTSLSDDLLASNDTTYLSLADASRKLFQIIKQKYQGKAQDDWKLWFDAHGGFRDLNLTILSAVNLLVANNDPNDAHPKPIPTNAIFTVLHETENVPEKPDIIKDQKAYYLADSISNMSKFLAYGEYIARDFTPYMGNDPYVFVDMEHSQQHLNIMHGFLALLESENIPFYFNPHLSSSQYQAVFTKERIQQAKVTILLLTNHFFKDKDAINAFLIALAALKKNCHEDLEHYYHEHIKVIWCEEITNGHLKMDLTSKSSLEKQDLQIIFNHELNFLNFYKYYTDHKSASILPVYNGKHLDHYIQEVINEIKETLTRR